MRREAAASWAVQSGNVRHLKCEHCENRTPHVLVRPAEMSDYSEEENARASGRLREFVAMMDFLGTMGVWVTVGAPEGGLVDIRHYLDGTEPAWRVVLGQDLSVADRVRMLNWAWALMPPKEGRWDGAVCEDEYGEFRGHYRT